MGGNYSAFSGDGSKLFSEASANIVKVVESYPALIVASGVVTAGAAPAPSRRPVVLGLAALVVCFGFAAISGHMRARSFLPFATLLGPVLVEVLGAGRAWLAAAPLLGGKACCGQPDGHGIIPGQNQVNH